MRFGAAGGDIGSGASRYLALDHLDRVVAVDPMDAGLPVHLGDHADLAPEERDFLDSAAGWARGCTPRNYASFRPYRP